jgi:hypothetical protein
MSRKKTDKTAKGFIGASRQYIEDDECKGIHCDRSAGRFSSHGLDLRLVGIVIRPKIDIFIVGLARHQV